MHITGCEIEMLDHASSTRWLDFVLGRGPAPGDLGDRLWLLCHCEDGVTWGCREGPEWRLGSSFFADLCPVPSESNVLEMRVFSPVAEVLIWRADGGFSGRVLRDGAAGHAGDSPDRPDDEERLLLAERIAEQRDSFTRVSSGSGEEQALPVSVGAAPPSSWPRLRVRHYFARDEQTGGVRVVATRLVEIK